GRQNPFVARDRTQRVTDASLGLSEAVVGCGVDIAHPGRPRRAYNCFGLLAAHRYPVTPHRRGAQPQRSYFERGSSEWASFEIRHPAISVGCRFLKPDIRGVSVII